MSETTNLQLKKHDNVATNTNAFDIENYLNGNWDKIDTAYGNTTTNINAKYTKPVGGIPKTDLASDVQTSLGKADTALQTHQDISGKEDKSNKVTSISSESTNTQYPSAKLLYDKLAEKQTEIDNLQTDVEDLRNASYKVLGTGTDITLNDTAKGRLLKNELSGQTSQDTSKIVYKCDGTETGTYYFTYNNVNYQFIMPTVANGDILVFNTTTLVLSLNDTAITTETGTTGTQLTFLATPNPIYECPIKNVTGNANEKIKNKNLFDIVYELQKQYNSNGEESIIKYYTLANNVISISRSLYNGSIFFNKFKILSGNYTLSFDYNFRTFVSGQSLNCNVRDFTNLQSIQNKVITTPKGKGYLTFTIQEDTEIGIRIQPQANASDILDITNIQLEQGLIPTSYVPHAEQNYPFTFAEGQRGMQGTTLEDDGIHQKSKQRILDGTENFTKPVAGKSVFQFNMNDLSIKMTECFCSHFKQQIINSNILATIDNNKFVVQTPDGLNYSVLYFRDDDFSTLDDFKTFLTEQYANGTPVIVEYELAEPDIIQYNQTQQAQYNNKKANASSYDGITIMSSESDELGFDMKVTAIGDINAKITTIEEDYSENLALSQQILGNV